MAPRASTRRNQQAQSGIFELGVQGRKTGIFLPQSDIRDENGMEPIDGLFSSPEKTRTTPNGFPNDRTLGEAEMELDENTGPGPASMARGIKLPLPRGKSPLKTNLQSPAVRNPNFDPTMSSPARGAIVGSPESGRQSVNRRLDFGATKTNGLRERTNGSRANSVQEQVPGSSSLEHDEVDEEGSASSRDDSIVMNGQDDSDLVETNPNPDPEVEPEDEIDYGDESPVVEPQGPAKRGARTGRPRKGRQAVTQIGREEEPAAEERPAKRTRALRNSNNSEDVEESGEEVRNAKRQRTASNPSKAKSGRGRPKNAPQEEADDPQEGGESSRDKAKPKKPGRKRKSSLPSKPSPIVPKRGPPMPKGRGLVSLRREGSDGMSQTRSGRHSFKPLQFWRGERANYVDDVVDDITGRRKFVTSTIKELVRAEDPEPPAKRPKSKASGSKSKSKRQADEPEEEEREPWELEEGDIEGEVVEWHPDHLRNPPGPSDPVDHRIEKLAISAEAIDLRGVHGAGFRFSKVVNLPFMGSGVLDLPPGTEKMPKNARKMQLVFFVFYGKVEVTVHNNAFRIGTGGMFFVPRGNYYSVKNDYDSPARLWFAQACDTIDALETLEDRAESGESHS